MVSDLLVLAFIIAITVNYNNEANLAPLSLFMILQLGILWYFCRICMFLFPVISNYVIYTILLIGLIEAIWGLGQLYNFLPSKHFFVQNHRLVFQSRPLRRVYCPDVSISITLLAHI